MPIQELFSSADGPVDLCESLPSAPILPMPVELQDLEAASRQYEQTIAKIAGSPSVLDLVHLGLGARWSHRIPGAGRFCSRRHGRRRRFDRHLSRQTPHDFDVSNSESRPPRAVAGDGSGKGGNASSPPGRRCFNSSRQGSPGYGRRFCGSRCCATVAAVYED